jgi:hypothetical protein
MYTIDIDSILKFLTPEFMPVLACSTVQAAAVDGALDVIKVTYVGNAYVSTPSISIVGDGSGATAVGTLSGATLSNVTLTNRGSGYHVANATVTGGAPSANAQARAIIGPPGGHGKNPIDELGAYYVMVTAKLNYDEGAGDFPVTNDFRRIGILADPQNHGSNLRANANTLTAVYSLTTANTTAAFAVDEIITGNVSGAVGKILSTTDPVVGGAAETRFIQPLTDANTNFIGFQVNDYITGSNSGSVGRVTAVNDPEVKLHSGTVLYVDNRRAISRSADQAESIHIVIEF